MAASRIRSTIQRDRSWQATAFAQVSGGQLATAGIPNDCSCPLLRQPPLQPAHRSCSSASAPRRPAAPYHPAQARARCSHGSPGCSVGCVRSTVAPAVVHPGVPHRRPQARCAALPCGWTRDFCQASCEIALGGPGGARGAPTSSQRRVSRTGRGFDGRRCGSTGPSALPRAMLLSRTIGRLPPEPPAYSNRDPRTWTASGNSQCGSRDAGRSPSGRSLPRALSWRLGTIRLFTRSNQLLRGDRWGPLQALRAPDRPFDQARDAQAVLRNAAVGVTRSACRSPGRVSTVGTAMALQYLNAGRRTERLTFVRRLANIP